MTPEELRIALLKAISSHLWNGYEYTLPLSPGHMANELLEHLEAQGWIFNKGETNETPN